MRVLILLLLFSAVSAQTLTETEARQECEAELLPEAIQEAKSAPSTDPEVDEALTAAILENYRARLELCILDKTLTDEEFLEVLKEAFPAE